MQMTMSRWPHWSRDEPQLSAHPGDRSAWVARRSSASPRSADAPAARAATSSSPRTSAWRYKAILGPFEVGTGVVPGRGTIARLPRLIGRGRALEVLLGADDVDAERAER